MSVEKKPLNLDTFVSRHSVVIDGHSYLMRNQHELSVVTLRRLQLLGERIDAIEHLEAPTSADDAEYLAVTREFVATVLMDLPAEVLKKLEIGHTTAIVLDFLGVPPQVPGPAATTTLRPTRTEQQKKRRTGAKSSRH